MSKSLTPIKSGAFAMIAYLGLVACDGGSNNSTGRDTIDEDGLATHIATLASDEFGGRAPFSEGEEKTVQYLASEFRAMGLQPGNGESYFQDVPLVSIEASSDTSLTITRTDGTQVGEFSYGDEVVIGTTRNVARAAINASDMVFVGYGINAPEYGWNDYEGIDVKGKTVVILVNDPGYATRDETLFGGFAMTYYGRWTYKYEEAARQGAAGALIVHDTGAAGYGWGVVRGSWTGPQFDLVREDGNASRVAIEGWMTDEVAQTVFTAAGLELEAMKTAAATRGFKAVPMNLQATGAVANVLKYANSRNVVAVLPGSATPEEYFVYMAHWDHLGTDSKMEGDNIFNGALDNATGTAALLEIAAAYASLDEAPARSVIFLAVTAEEQGLLGSAYYAEHPVVPLAQTVAGLNMDGLGYYGPTNDIVVTGYGASELDAHIERATALVGRRVAPDPEPEKGYYYRSDHFPLAKQGVPMIYPGTGYDHIEHGFEYGMQMAEDYVANRYHTPADEYDPTWDLSGAVLDTQLFFDVGLEIARSSTWPNWHETSEFRAIRDKSLASPK